MRVGAKPFVVALAGAAAAYVALRLLLPEALGAESLLPHAAALAVAVMLALGLSARADPSVRRAARGAAIACGLAATILGVGLAFGGPEVVTGSLRAAGRTTCAGLAFVAWLGAHVLERRAGRRLADLTSILVGLALAAFLFENGRSLHGALTGRDEQGWNVYHYYMGSKYFPELGYGELYSAHLAADEEGGGRDYGFVEKARSMATYAETPRAELLRRFDRRALFTEARWQAFRRDVHAFRPLLDEEKWRGVLLDLGYHPSPAWTVIGTPFANLVSVRGRGWWWLVNSDLLLHVLCLAAMLWAFGLRPTAAAVLWVAAVPLNSGNFAGAFLRHDWLHSAILAVALYRRGHPASAGVALSWGAMTRIFPGVLALPIVLRAVAALVRGGPRAVSPAHGRFAVVLTVACALLFGASHLTGRGVRAWPEWIDIISKHGHLHPATSNRRVGVGRLVLHDPQPADPFATVPGTYAERVESRVWHRRAVQVVGLALLVLAVWRRDDLDATILMTFGVFLATTLSRYHGSLWLLLFFLGAGTARASPDRVPWPAVFAGTILLGAIGAFPLIPGLTARYFLLNYEVLAMFTVLCIAYAISDRRAHRAAGVT